jgi:two-component system nitrogen regulation response regulator GlnG
LAKSPVHETSWDETLETPYKGNLLAEATILCFGIVWHTDHSRIGAIAPVCFDRGGTAVISRLTPDFHDLKSPLLDRHVSRSEIVVERDKNGRISLTPNSSTMPLIVNGVRVLERKTFDMEELGNEIILMLGNSVILSIFKSVVKNFQDPLLNEYGLIGISHSIARVRTSIAQLADTRLPVLILGETGTGKELVARALHRTGRRADAPLITANMAAISPSLATAELFGSKRGAFTGAFADKPGLFKLADKGTLFLDEIGDASTDVQSILLRTLETGEVLPVGGTAAVNVDVRVIAATDKILDKALAPTNFNQPLFQRLNVATITLAPLQQRRVDIGLLIRHFLRDDSDGLPPYAPQDLPVQEVHRMVLDPWPGNVRQLYNAVRRLRLGEPFGQDRRSAPAISLAAVRDGPPAVTPTANAALRAYRNPSEISDADLLAALDSCNWVIKDTARLLKVSRTSLYLLMSRCAQIRSIHDVSEAEIGETMDRLEGGISAWVKHLRVGREALRKRIVAMQATR